jgi:hypothetical protein
MADFVYSCSNLGIDFLLFVRHANAEPPKSGTPARKDVPHDWKRNDQMRPLSKKGKTQCVEKASILKGLHIRINLSSPARRASETAALLTLDPSGGGDISLRMVETLHPAGMSDTCEDLFDEMGYGPLSKYFAVMGGKEAFFTYGEKVCEEMNMKISGPAVGSMLGDSMAIFGHAVFINAVAFIAATQWNISNASDILEYDLGEADAILVDKRNNRVEYLKGGDA